MKSLSLAKPLVLVMVGLPGSGKSFFARQFSETFSAPVISYDRMRHILTAAAGPGKETQNLVGELVTYQLDELFKTKKSFMLDGGGASRTQRIELRKLARAADYDVLLIWVQTDTNTSQYRSMKRSSRRTDDQYNPSLSADEYTHAAKRFTPPQKNEPYVVISGKHTYASQARIVLKKLVAPREAQPIVNHEGRKPADDDAGPRRGILVR